MKKVSVFFRVAVFSLATFISCEVVAALQMAKLDVPTEFKMVESRTVVSGSLTLERVEVTNWSQVDYDKESYYTRAVNGLQQAYGLEPTFGITSALKARNEAALIAYLNEAYKSAILRQAKNVEAYGKEVYQNAINSGQSQAAALLAQANAVSNSYANIAKATSDLQTSADSAVGTMSSLITELNTELSSLEDDVEEQMQNLTNQVQIMNQAYEERANAMTNFYNATTKEAKEYWDTKYQEAQVKYDNASKEVANLQQALSVTSLNQSAVSSAVGNLEGVVRAMSQRWTQTELQVTDLESKQAQIEASLKDLTQWFGNYTDDAKYNVFTTPAKFNKDNIEATHPTLYDANEHETIFTMLKDMGYVTAVDDDMDETYEAWGYDVRTKYRFRLEEDQNVAGKTNTHANFNAPYNWVDQITIKTNAQNKYVAMGTPTINDDDMSKIISGEASEPPYYFWANKSNNENNKTNILASKSLCKGPINWFNVLTEKEEQQLGEYENPAYFLLKYEEDSGTMRTNTYAKPYNPGVEIAKRNGFPAPKNWADGTTLVCTDGVYRVASSYTNAMETMDGLLRHNGGGGLRRRIPTDAELAGDTQNKNPWNIKNKKNPANASFDWDDIRGNFWNNIIPRTDSSVTEDYWWMYNNEYTLKALEDLGRAPFTKYGYHYQSMTNVWTLSNFPLGSKYQIPFIYDIGSTTKIRELYWASDGNNFEFVDPPGEMPTAVSKEITLKGFNGAASSAIPIKKKKTPQPSSGLDSELTWISILPITKIKSSDNTEITMANKNYPTNIVLEAASDTNLKFETENKSDGLHIKVHVYWK